MFTAIVQSQIKTARKHKVGLTATAATLAATAFIAHRARMWTFLLTDPEGFDAAYPPAE